MKRTLIIIAASAAALVSCSTGMSRMEKEFRNPPQDARPRVWWHWEDGNVTKDGIRKDLEWMQRIGIGGFHHFDASIAIKPVVEKRLVYMDDGWKDAFRYAIEFADSLGMSMGIASSPGWSSTGGPWVSEEDAMKKLIWSTVDAPCGHFSGALPKPRSRYEFYRDIAVVAFRLPETDGQVRSIRVNGNSNRVKWNIFPADYNIVLEASDDGSNYREVCRIPNTNSESLTVNIPATSAEHFRLTNIDGGRIPGFELFTRSRVEHAEEKAGFSSPYDLHDFPTVAPDGESFAGTEDVIDITSAFSEDGTLEWDVPEGEWRIIRYGYSLTGKKNGPAPKEATGLEVDKLDPEAWCRYFHNYLDMYVAATGGLVGRKGIGELLVDSYEAQWQTWTPKMAEEFARRRGYDLTPWMPVLSGEIICSPEATEKFLFDWRRTIGELYVENYARIREYTREYGIRDLYLESQENGRVYVVDGMDVKKNATVPMAACWTPVDRETHHSSIPMAVADMKESSSVAHLYGMRHVATESFTADGTEGAAYSFCPAVLKKVADIEFASGVNRIFIHESSHQPLDDCVPGLGLRKYGQWFSRHETWAEQASAWTDYLARSSYMLMQGDDVADILVYYGEDTNVTGRYGKYNFVAPAGYSFDFINPTGLFDIKVRGGRIVAPSGASYAVLCLDNDGLPQSSELAARIDELKSMGAKICTRAELASVIGAAVPRDVDTDADIRFVHRRDGRKDIYWICKPSADTTAVTISFRACGLEPRCWDPATGEISQVSYSCADGRTTVTLDMDPEDAKFIVFGGRKAGKSFQAGTPSILSVTGIDGPWAIEFPSGVVTVDSLHDYSLFDDEAMKYFSGTAVYRNEFELGSVPEMAWIDLGEVFDLAEVSVNGVDLGVVWKKPFRVAVHDALKPGTNVLEVRVVNCWANRLIGDEQPDCPGRTTYSSWSFFNAGSPLRPAGMAGPVELVTASAAR